jgi:hypothetical protein
MRLSIMVTGVLMAPPVLQATIVNVTQKSFVPHPLAVTGPSNVLVIVKVAGPIVG